MSIRYSLFGIPKNLDEFIDKAIKEIKNVNITVENYEDERTTNGILPNYNTYVQVQTDSFSLRLKKYSYERRGDLIETVKGKVKIEKSALEEGIRTAEKLEGLSLKVTLNNQPIEKAKKILKDFDQNYVVRLT